MPKTPESKLKANEKYLVEKTKRLTFKMRVDQDSDIIDFFENQPNKADALRKAIRDAIKKEKNIKKTPKTP
jgi:rubrerythrin